MGKARPDELKIEKASIDDLGDDYCMGHEKSEACVKKKSRHVILRGVANGSETSLIYLSGSRFSTLKKPF